MLQLHNLQPKEEKKRSKRLGRGSGSHGDYSGRGIKGQKARSGVSGLKKRGVKAWLMKAPKSRGFTSPHAKRETVTLDQLESHFQAKEEVNPFALKRLGLIDDHRVGVKVLSNGKLTKALTVKVHGVSSGAREAIEKAGGSIELIKPKQPERKHKPNASA